MRDDLFELFQKLVSLYSEKKTRLEKFISNEIELRHLLKSENLTAINNVLQDDTEIVTRLDGLEYDIRVLLDEICEKAGIDKESFKQYFLERDIEPIPELKSIQDDINKYLAGIVAERNDFIKSMDNRLAEIKKEIKSLSDLNRIKGLMNTKE